MAFLLFIIANVALFVRPNELFPALGNMPIYLYSIVGSILCSYRQIQNQLSPRTLIQQPINLCVLLITVAVPISHLSVGYAGGAVRGLSMMMKITLYYLALVSVINSTARLKWMLLTIGVSAFAMTAYSINDFYVWLEDWEGRRDVFQIRSEEEAAPEDAPRLIRHIADHGPIGADGQEEIIYRICGLGNFKDPNDFSLIICVMSTISICFLFDPKLDGVRYLWLIPLVIAGWALYLTHSRGGLLSFGVASMAWLGTRYGGRVALMLGLLGAAAVPFALGRQGNIDISGGTGQQRIQIWAEGLAEIKNARVLFGIGEGQFNEHVGIQAHNSFIHAYVELGLFGGTFFWGAFALSAWGIYQIRMRRHLIRDPELVRLLPYMAAIIGSQCMGMMSLSRVYDPPTYMVAGVVASYINLCGFHQNFPRPITMWNMLLAQRLAIASVGFLGCCYLFVRIFARFG